LYSSLNIIIIIKYRDLGCVGDVACMGRKRNAYKVVKERTHLKDLGVDGRPILQWTLKSG
jgi:hypothetical protein